MVVLSTMWCVYPELVNHVPSQSHVDCTVTGSSQTPDSVGVGKPPPV